MMFPILIICNCTKLCVYSLKLKTAEAVSKWPWANYLELTFVVQKHVKLIVMVWWAGGFRKYISSKNIGTVNYDKQYGERTQFPQVNYQ